jgi:alkanesulfonate monooxygenase SsuD/methylene tetrahydromethanopterin reductase-like flavin-dependent oxidoreductase (luciferase family)
VLARSAAALDLLSGGRVELGLGAGYFLEAIAAMGGPRRSAAENVDALEEAIAVIRALWAPGPPVRLEGRYYRLDGAEPGPPPAHPIGIWVGAYKRRMLELTGRTADGWVPSTGYAAPEDLGPMTRTLDAAAETAGRDPARIRRAFNLSGRFGSGRGFLQGPPAAWADQLTTLVLEHGMSAFILGPGRDAVGDLRRFAEEVAPAVREAVAQARARGEEPEPGSMEAAPADVADRLASDHETIAGPIDEVDAALVAMVEDERRLESANRAVDRLADALLPHLQIEEDQLLDPIARLDIRV